VDTNRLSLPFLFSCFYSLDPFCGGMSTAEAYPTILSKNTPPQDTRTIRGGILVLSPSEGIHEFPLYARPLVVSMEYKPEPDIANETWKQQMIQLHSCESGGKRNRSSRGGVKRKRVSSEEELIWSLERLLEKEEDMVKQNGSNPLFGEEDAVMLEQLNRHHYGNNKAAEFNLLVQLSGGQGTLLARRFSAIRTRPDLTTCRSCSNKNAKVWGKAKIKTKVQISTSRVRVMERNVRKDDVSFVAGAAPGRFCNTLLLQQSRGRRIGWKQRCESSADRR
jgi:hypothetical protein